jgi:hypothetical protein
VWREWAAADDGVFTPCALNEATNFLKSRLSISGNAFVGAAQLFDGGDALSDGARKPIPQIVAGLVFQALDAHGGIHESSIVAQ